MSRLGLLFLLFAAVFCQDHRKEKCGDCDASQCGERPSGCRAGMVKDECGCCLVCARSLYQICPHRDAPRYEGEAWSPDCGQGLECLVRDDLEEGDRPEALCYCEKTAAVCGSDGVTYENVCELRETANLNSADKITKVSDQPCDAPPSIVSSPEPVKNKTGSYHSFICEAVGFPIPTIEWTWTRVDGKTMILPTDDLRFSVNMRGGPERHQITGWLQIMDIQDKDQGDYTCVAQNMHGMDQAVARLNVLRDDVKEKQRKSLKDIVVREDEP